MTSLTASGGDLCDAKEFMKLIINHLIQLQELIEARAQQEAVMSETRLSELDEAIRVLMQGLPQDVSLQFRKLRERGYVAVAPVAAGVCSACGMSLPVSLVHSIRAAEMIHSCPNCARMLFCHPEAPPRRIEQKRKRNEPPKVGIARFSSPELMIPDLQSSDRDAVITEICAKLEAEGFVDNATKLAEKALRREAIASTAVDHGLAFPHVRGVEGGALTLALGLKRKGIRFEEGERALTRIVFFMVIPTPASAFYLKLLSGLTQALSDKTVRDKLLEMDTPDKLWKALLSATKSTVK